MEEKVVAISGGFDPIRFGHLKLIEDAKRLGGKLVVILNNDNWLKKNKGWFFMNADERKAILLKNIDVDEVIITNHKINDKDNSVCNELAKLNPTIFANGGNHTEKTIPEYELCKKNGIQTIFNVGGEKVQSSYGITSEEFNKAKNGKL